MSDIEYPNLEEMVKYCRSPVNKKHTKKILELLFPLTKEHIGAIVILGYDERKPHHTRSISRTAMNLDFFKYDQAPIKEKETQERFYQATRYDGAVLISGEGYVLSSGRYIRSDPVCVMDMQERPEAATLSQRFGFKFQGKGANTRELNAKASSFFMFETTVVALSAYHTIRIFEGGNTIFSPIQGESEIEDGIKRYLHKPPIHKAA